MHIALRIGCAARFLLWIGVVGAQFPGITRYDVEQGLPQSMVNHVVQDSLGFIWFGTGDGLARFDGTRIIEFKHDMRDTASLSNNEIWSITALTGGDLLVGTATGLDRYLARTGTFRHVRTSVLDDGCWQTVHARGSRILLYSPLSTNFIVIEGERIRIIPSGHGPTYAMHCDAGGERIRYHVFPDTLVDLDLAGGKEQWVIIPAHVMGKVNEVLPLADGTLVFTNEGAWIMDDHGQSKPVPGEAGTLLRAGEGRKRARRSPTGHLWCTMDQVGVIEVDEQWNILQFHPLVHKDDRPLMLTSIAFDRQGNTWVGSDGKGVFLIAPERIKFNRAAPGSLPGWVPDSWFVRGFAQWDSTRVIVSFHQGGTALFNERIGRFEALDLAAVIGTPLPGRTVSRMLNDAQGHLWLKVGTEVVVLDRHDRRVIDRLNVMGGAFLVDDHHGGILLAQTTGIGRVTIRQGRIFLEPLGFTELQRRMVNQVDRFATDRSGQLWTSYLNEGVEVSGAEGPRSLGVGWEVLANAGPKLGSIVPLPGGTMLMTTDRGLLEVDPSTRALMHIRTRHEGLPDDHVCSVVLEGDSAWWVSTNKGLCRAVPIAGDARLRVRAYTTADGLQSKEFNNRAWFRSASGRIYFGGINGFNHFTPDQVHDDPDRPPVRVIRLWNELGEYDMEVSGTTSVDLPYPRNQLNIELAVLEFSAPEGNTYKWRMKGHRDEWTSARASAPIALENVPPGNFILETVGVNADGVEGDVCDLLRIAVVRPFWATSWAKAVAIVLLALLIAWTWMRTYRKRMRGKLADAERETRELRMRMRLARDIHDDVGSGLARIAALARSPKRGTDSDQRFEKLGNISGELLENLRDVVWLNDPRQGTLNALLTRIRDHAHDLFEDSGTTVEFDLPEPLPTRAIGGTARRNIFLVAKEALHNAHKYSGAKVIQVRWQEGHDGFIFEVADDGAGISSDKPQGGGQGSGNMHQRCEEAGAGYERSSVPGRGTTVSIRGRSSCLDG